MKKILFATLLTASFAFSAPASAKEKIRLDASFKIMEFNSAASDYMERPTFLELIVRKKKPEQLYILSDFIKKSDTGIAMGGYEFTSLSATAIDDYIAAIDKYFAWHKIASQDGDIIDKEIAKAMGRKKSLKVKFGFYSANAQSHYLTLQTCAVGTCMEPTMVLDYKNAQALKDTLLTWKAGNLQGISEAETNDKYK